MKLQGWKDLKPQSKVYWLRLLFAVLAAFICSPFVLGLNNVLGILVGILVYVASYYIFRDVMKLDIKTIGARKLITTGIGSYAILWIVFWTVLNTVHLFA